MMRWIYGVGGAVIVFTFLSDLWWAINYELAANWSLTVLTVCVTVFTVLYAARSNWKANPIGAILLAKSIFLTITLWQIVASVFVSTDYPFRQQIRFVIYALGALAYITMVVSLWRYQHQDRSALRRQKVI